METLTKKKHVQSFLRGAHLGAMVTGMQIFCIRKCSQQASIPGEQPTPAALLIRSAMLHRETTHWLGSSLWLYLQSNHGLPANVLASLRPRNGGQGKMKWSTSTLDSIGPNYISRIGFPGGKLVYTGVASHSSGICHFITVQCEFIPSLL